MKRCAHCGGVEFKHVYGVKKTGTGYFNESEDFVETSCKGILEYNDYYSYRCLTCGKGWEMEQPDFEEEE